jgi:hypothetical protein
LIFSAGHFRASVARLGNSRGSKVTGADFSASGRPERARRAPIKLACGKFEITVTLRDRDPEETFGKFAGGLSVARDAIKLLACGQPDFAIAQRPSRT